MSIWENVLVALQGLAANKLRSVLTLLGIIIGVLAVILGTAIGQGARVQVRAQINSLGSNVISIFAGQGQRGGSIASQINPLTMDDVKAIRKNCPSISGVAPQVQSSAQIKYGNKNTTTTVLCTTPEFVSIRGFQIERGRFFGERDVRGMRKVCIVGKTTSRKLFGDSTPIGKSLRLKGLNFRIVGLMASKGSAMFGDPDDQIYIPITTGMKAVFGIENISQISAQAANAEQTTRAVSELEEALRKSHKLMPSEESDFQIRTQAEFLQIGDQATQTITFVLAAITAVTLLVGGIGIMNIMLVSVTERTREIGLRKAVGARSGDILWQFLIESMTLSVTGGLIGIGIGFGITALVRAVFGFPAQVSSLWVTISFGSSAGVGIFFGLYPAYKAAQLDPIEALRYQ